MLAATLREVPADTQEDTETHTDRLLRIAKSAKEAKSDGGIDVTRMTNEERKKVLFGQ